jgi:hypothetical protein
VEREEDALDRIGRAERRRGSRESFSSPLGFMALGRRPIDL